MREFNEPGSEEKTFNLKHLGNALNTSINIKIYMKGGISMSGMEVTQN